MQLDHDRINPHYFLAAYGIQNHYFVWAVAHGALDDIDSAVRFEHWTQPALFDDVAPLRPERPTRNVYRSRPNKSDVPAWNRETLRALPVRHRLSQDRVLR